MSFFGFDTTLPRDRQQDGRGFFETRADPFAGYQQGQAPEDDVIDFEDTYDGLGDALQEEGDTFNDDTFGGGGGGGAKVGKDFDFSGQTAQHRDTLLEEQALHYARQPPSRLMPTQSFSKPTKTGYESYKQPDYIPQLEANASIWGLPAKKTQEPQQQQQQQQQPPSGPSRKMMSLEEVEASMRQQRSPAPPQSYQAPPPQQQQLPQMQPQQQQIPGFPQIMQRPQGLEPSPGPVQQQNRQSPLPIRQDMPPHAPQQPMQILQRQQQQQQQQQIQPPMPMPMPTPMQQQGPPPQQGHARGPSQGGPQITQAQQMMNMSEQDREAFLAEEAKRAKRNHKIFLLSRHNGLMTPQDKNFITRIQLQQLMTAAGIAEGSTTDAQLAEDFYYQVYSQIRGAPRQNPHQPLSNFAQTYLFQTGGRPGRGRHPRGGDNHMQRMEQQVQRAVEAAKARPKNKQLTVEGSLGKISFSNSKTPRPLLNFKRPETEARMHKINDSAADRKRTLRDIETVYATLMQMEDHERHIPPPPTEESNPGAIQGHIEWRQQAQELNQRLWSTLKVMEPIQPNATSPHPFIAILSHSKGKKLIPRIYRHIDDQQRITMLTLVMIHLDQLDVIRNAYPHPDEPKLSPAVRDSVELFSQAVLPPLFAYVNDAPLNIISGLLGLVLDRVNVQAVMRTKIGTAMLTMLISRAELIKQMAGSNDNDWTQWSGLYGRLFDLAEPVLPYIFSAEPVSQSEDVHVWRFLAAMGVGASPDQQQRLVLGVKDRVMETVGVSKTLPPEMANRKLGEVNLFMRAIGLDVELLG